MCRTDKWPTPNGRNAFLAWGVARPYFQRLGLKILASGPQMFGAVWVASMFADAIMVLDLGIGVDLHEDEDEYSDSGFELKSSMYPSRRRA